MAKQLACTALMLLCACMLLQTTGLAADAEPGSGNGQTSFSFTLQEDRQPEKPEGKPADQADPPHTADRFIAAIGLAGAFAGGMILLSGKKRTRKPQK